MCMCNNMVCSFFGHRNITITKSLVENTKEAIYKALKDNIFTFYFGGFGDFDDLCYKIVTQLKNDFPQYNIQRIFCVPTEKMLRKRPAWLKQENYEEIIFLTPSFDSWYKSIYFRNCAMIDNSDFCIFYVENRENSGAYKTYKYALKKKVMSVNLFE